MPAAPAAPAAAAPAAEERKIAIVHLGQGRGPIDTACGRLNPGQSLEMPASYAEKLLRANSHLKKASDLVPGGAAADKKLADLVAANAALKAENAALKDAADKSAAQLKEYQAAGSKKDLDALNAKYAPAPQA